MIECGVAEAAYQLGTAWMVFEEIGLQTPMLLWGKHEPHTVHVTGWLLGEELGCEWWSESLPFGRSEVVDG